MGPLRLLAWGPVKHNVQMHFRLSVLTFGKRLVPRYNSRVRYSLGTNVNAPFLQEPTLAGAPRDYVHSYLAGTPGVNTTSFCDGSSIGSRVAALVPGHQAVWTAP